MTGIMDHRKFDVPVLRRPTKDSGKQLEKFKKIIEEKYGAKFNEFWDLHKWSIDNLEDFWAEIWDFIGVISSSRFEKVIDLSIPIYESSQWFQGAKLNLAENLLKYKDEHLSMIVTGEDGNVVYVSFRDMYETASLYAAALRKFGLKKGDIVVCYMSNKKEAIIAMQAVVSIGAIFSGALPLLGSQAVLTRFQQVKPKILITMDRFQHEGEEIDMLSKVQSIAKGLPSLQKVIILSTKRETSVKSISKIRNSCLLEDFLKLGIKDDGTVPPMIFEQVSFSHPVFISYTSGTTGLPKAIIHGSGGLLRNAVNFSLHTEADRNSVWFTVSPVGWVSWTMVTNLHFLGYTLFLYEGSPYFSKKAYFWDLMRDFKISHLMIPSSILDEFQRIKCVPKEYLPDLKVFMSAGSIVKPKNFDFVYNSVKSDVLFSSSYGATELLGFCLASDSTLPIYKGEIPAICLGDSIEVVDKTGKPITGDMGELVITKPMPSLPLGLLNDADGSKYRENYFSKYKGMFALNDVAIVNPITKGIVVCCRSDETLKQRGCRFGSSEIYNVVGNIPEVLDSICVSQYNADMDERAVLFLKTIDKFGFLSTELQRKVKEAITTELTARHVPAIITGVSDIPYNVNGKKMETIVKKIINHLPYNAETIRNPRSLTYFQNREELSIWL